MGSYALLYGLKSEQGKAGEVKERKKKRNLPLLTTQTEPPFSHNQHGALNDQPSLGGVQPPSPAKKGDALKFGILGAANIA